VTAIVSTGPSTALRLWEDVLGAGGTLALPARQRVIYVWMGGIIVRGDEGEHRVEAGAARFARRACAIEASGVGAKLLRYELLATAADREPTEPTTATRVLLEHSIALAVDDAYLMRADRVDFPPGGVALPHRHRGGGIRCLVTGSLTVTVGGGPPHLMVPGSAWFESGLEPVVARASLEEPTSFVRVAILPHAIRGKSSIIYVDPEDAQRGAPRSYTVYVDEPIDVR
jgi:quercetin dioxygenase-like cupin family protein